MTFVYPILLGGLLLAGLPVLLHFLVRQKATSVMFPAFRFLLQKRRSNTRNLRLRHLLLLLLRIALIILICLALARPRLFHEQLGLLSREKPVAMILVFDTSPSMGYRSGNMTRFDLAQERCRELLNQLPEDGRVLILDTSDPASFAREDWLHSLEKARQRVQSLTIRPDNTPVTKALDEAFRRFEEWDDPAGATMPRFVCVFSDRTRGSWSANASKRPAKEDAVKVQTFYFDVGIDEPVDLAILQAELPANRQSFTEGEKIPLRVAVKATGAKMKNTLLLLIDGQEVLQIPVDPDADNLQTRTLEIDTAELKLGPGLHQAEVKLETTDDALSFNNRRYLTFNVKERQKILVLADEKSKGQRFAHALEALLYKVELQTLQEKADLQRYEAVFLVGVAAPPDPLWQTLAAYVQQGKGVGIVPAGDDLERDAYNSGPAKKVMPASIERKVDSAGSAWNLPDLLQNGFQHPFLAPYRNWHADGEYDFLRLPRTAQHYWEVKAYDGKNIVVKYEDDGKRPAILERHEKGKVLLLTTPMDERKPAWNNYDEDITSFYLALVMMCAKHLCPEPANPILNYQFGPVPPVVQKTLALAFPKYRLSSGEFSEEIRFDEKDRWVGERLPREGNFTVSGSNPEKQETTALHKFSINIAGEESDLTRVPSDEIEALLGKDALVLQNRHKSLLDTLEWDDPVELFPWLMVLLLFLLALENLLANRFYSSREMAQAQG